MTTLVVFVAVVVALVVGRGLRVWGVARPLAYAAALSVGAWVLVSNGVIGRGY